MENQRVITATNLSPLIEIVTWFLLVCSILAVLARLTLKLSISRKLAVDDYLLVASLVLSVAQSVAVHEQSEYGIGQPLRSLSVEQLDGALKSEYVALVFYTLSLGAAKLSTSGFIWNLTPDNAHKRYCLAMVALIGLWVLTTLFTGFFQCDLPAAWDYINNACFDRVAWWTYVAVMNIITDAALFGEQVVILVTLKVPWSKRAFGIAIFLGRAFTVVASITQLVYFRDEAVSADPILNQWRSVICNQVVVCLSIVAVCLPYIKPFMRRLESGLMRPLQVDRSQTESSPTVKQGRGVFRTRTWSRLPDRRAPSYGLMTTMRTMDDHDDPGEMAISEAPGWMVKLVQAE